VNDSAGVFLGVIALSTLIMALIQVGAIIAALRLARQAQQTLAAVRQDVRPLISKATVIVEEASRTAALASAQMQKVDRLVSDLAKRVDETSSIVQHAIVTPAREAGALVAGIKAALGVLRGIGYPGRPGRHSEEEDPLFIG
jgi:hypothetical protein